MRRSLPSFPLSRYGLFQSEVFWRDHYVWLEKHGYILRPRYHPDFVFPLEAMKQLRETGGSPYQLEVVIPSRESDLIDATAQDGSRVVIKRVSTQENPHEADIMRMLSSEPFRNHPNNRCLPLLDVLDVPDCPKEILLVLPFMHYQFEVPYETLGELVDFCVQALEGLQFMHHNNITHGDIKIDNIMIDARKSYPDGVEVHPQILTHTRDWKHKPRPKSRTVQPVVEYYIDFGLSRHFPPGETPHVTTTSAGLGMFIPEYKLIDEGKETSVDLFKLDIFCVGLMLRAIVNRYEWTEPLAAALTLALCDEPDMRPTIDEFIIKFNQAVEALGTRKLRWRAKGRGEHWLNAVLDAPTYWGRRYRYHKEKRPAIPLSGPNPRSISQSQ